MYRVVIVGCGFAGLFAAKALRRAPVEVVMVDRTNHHPFQALLYQVATGVLTGPSRSSGAAAASARSPSSQVLARTRGLQSRDAFSVKPTTELETTRAR